MIEELPSRTAGLPVHPRARPPGAVRPALRSAARRAPPARRRGARARRAGAPAARSPTSRTTSPPPRRSAAPGAASSTTSARRGRPPPALAFDEAAARLRTALELRIEDRGERAEVLLELGTASHRAGKALDALEAFRSAAEHRPRARRRASCSRAPRSATRTRAGARGSPTRARSSCSRRRPAALGDESSELRVGAAQRARARARLPGRPRARRDRARRTPSRWRGGSSDRAGLATVLMRAYWSRGTSSLEEILEMLTEAQRARRGAGRHGDPAPRRWPGACRRSSRSATSTSARREVAALRGTAEQTAQPFMLHVAEHYGSAIALCDGRLEEAEAMARRSHEWSRLLTGRDAVGRLRDPDVQRPPRAGAARGARAGDPDPRRRADARRAVAARPRLRARRARHGRRGAAGARAGRRRRAGRRSASRSGSASLTYLTDACAALGDEATAALVYPELEPLAGTNVMIGHLVACYGAADRYLGMLAATLGEWERAEEHFERAMELNRRMGAATWLAHTAYEYARLLLARGGGRARPGRRAARRGGGARRAHRHAGAARPHPGARLRPRRATAPSRRPVVPRGPDPAPRRPRPQQPRDRRGRCSSASTPPPTTSAASCARPAAPTAPRPPPTPTGTASSRRRNRRTICARCRST